MDTIVVAFEGEKHRERVQGMLEGSGTASCIPCRTAAEVRRVVAHQRVSGLVCSFKFSDGTAQELAEDLPASCPVLVVAHQGLLDLCRGPGVRKLPTPVDRGTLLAAVREMTEEARRLYREEKSLGGDRGLVDRAKLHIMERSGLTEAQAHRFLQKKSMETGKRLVEVAFEVLSLTRNR